MIQTLVSYVPLLGLTLVLECLCIAASAPKGQRARAVQVCVALNLLTHPVVTVLRWYGSAPIGPLEIGVLLLETAGFARLLPASLGRAFRMALVANVVSALAGVAIAAALA